MNVTVDDAAPQWDYFLASKSSCSSSRELAGWNLTDDKTADTFELWNGTETWSSTPGASMLLTFQGTRLILYSTLSPDGGNMSVVVDDISAIVSLYSPDYVYGNWVFATDGLDPGWMHAVTISMLDGMKVNVDKVVVQPPPPNAFPPAWPQGQLAALPNQTGIQLPPCPSITSTVNSTSATATTSVTPSNSATAAPAPTQSATKNRSGLLAGVIVGTGFAIMLIVVTGIFVRRYLFSRRQMNTRRESIRQSGPVPLKQLLTGARVSGLGSGQRHSRFKSSDSTGSFGNDNTEMFTDDVEKKHADIERGSTEMEKLPSIRHPSTIDMGSMFSRSTTPTPFSFPQAPAPIRAQPPLSHLNNIGQVADEPRMSFNPKNRGVPFNLSINTNVNSTRSSLRTKTKSSGWLTDDEALNRVSVAGPSRLGMEHSESEIGRNQEDDARSIRAISISGGSDRDATDTAEFYAAYARAGFLQSEPDDYEDVEDVDEVTNLTVSGEGYDDDDDAIDTPLIPPSPAIPSSNASVAHGGASVYSFTSGKRASKASRVLRSIHSASRSSMSKSMRHSVGKRSTQSSVGTPRSPESSTHWNARTPKTPVSAHASGSTRSRKSSTPSVLGHGTSVPALMSTDIPAIPAMAPTSAPGSSTADDAGADLMVSRLSAPPSAWSEAKKQLLMRPYKPPAFGPRARSESTTSTSSIGSGSVHNGSPELFPVMPVSSVLSIVEENSTPSISREPSSLD